MKTHGQIARSVRAEWKKQEVVAVEERKKRERGAGAGAGLYISGRPGPDDPV